MSTTQLRVNLADKFGPTVASDEKLMSELVSMCQMYNLSAEDLQYKWEALSFSSTRAINLFTFESCAALKAKLLRDRNAEQAKVKPGRAPIRAGGLGRFGPGSARLDGALKVGLPPTRTSGVVEDRKSNIAGPSKVTFKGPSTDAISRKKRAYKYMYEKVSERSEVLDEKIDEFSELIREHYEIPDLGDPNSATEEQITVVGRIVLEADSQNSKITESTLVLESSRMLGSGVRVPLRSNTDVKVRGGPKGVAGLGLFPGAIVAVKGKNGGGGWFAVDEFLALPALPSSPESLGTPPATKPEPGVDTSLSVAIACGPFTPDTDLDFKPWLALAESLKSSKPAVLLLIGPFIDTAHPSIKTGDISSTPIHLFREMFVRPLRDFLDLSPGSMVCLVPSVRDVISEHGVFPQAEFSIGLAGDHRIKMLPNPCTFSLNSISFAVTSVDVLFHLRKEEFFKPAQEVEPGDTASNTSGTTDSMSNLCRHLLQQRSFYPIFPVPQDLSADVNLDMSHSEGLKIGGGIDSDHVEDFAPDVLILPSRLKHFSKTIDNTVAINPSSLTKSTYATLVFNGHVPHRPVKEGITVDFVKMGPP